MSRKAGQEKLKRHDFIHELIFKSRKKKCLSFEAKKPHEFVVIHNRSALSKKEQPNTTGKTREYLNRSNICKYMAFGFGAINTSELFS